MAVRSAAKQCRACARGPADVGDLIRPGGALCSAGIGDGAHQPDMPAALREAVLRATQSAAAQGVDPISVAGEFKLLPSDGVDYDRFAWSVAIDGDTAIVGAPFDDTPAGVNAAGSPTSGLLPEQAHPLQGEGLLDVLDAPGDLGDERRQPSGGDHDGVAAQVAPDGVG